MDTLSQRKETSLREADGVKCTDEHTEKMSNQVRVAALAVGPRARLGERDPCTTVQLNVVGRTRLCCL